MNYDGVKIWQIFILKRDTFFSKFLMFGLISACHPLIASSSSKHGAMTIGFFKSVISTGEKYTASLTKLFL
jgi:hypothetical protein